jgi:hypothetical protein
MALTSSSGFTGKGNVPESSPVLVLDALVSAIELDELEGLVGSSLDGELVEGPLADLLSERLMLRLDLSPGTQGEWRVARRRVGPGQPAHVDGDEAVLGCARLFLDEGSGGELRFPRLAASPRFPRAVGRVVAWPTLDAEGRRNLDLAEAQGPLLVGESISLTWRAWPGGLDRVPQAPDRRRPQDPTRSREALGAGVGRAFVCVIDPGVPETTRDALRGAAEARGLVYEEVLGETIDPRVGVLPPGSVLFRPGVTWAASHAEALLYGPGVSTFNRGDDGPFHAATEPDLLFERAGIPQPRFAWIQANAPEALPGLVEWLGGFPLVLKVPGGEGGVGVLRADSLPALKALLELLLARGERVRLSAFVPDAMHWRLVVVGDQVVTAYRNPVRDDDFRSEPSDDPADYGLAPPPEAARIAIEAAHALGVDFVGADVLVDPSGACYLLEANFPCYFAQATDAATIDVAGPMLDHLLAAPVPGA